MQEAGGNEWNLGGAERVAVSLSLSRFFFINCSLGDLIGFYTIDGKVSPPPHPHIVFYKSSAD
jgi:hypothetical protein